MLAALSTRTVSLIAAAAFTALAPLAAATYTRHDTAGAVPLSPLPPLTGQTSEPLTLSSVSARSDFTIKGQDLDTWELTADKSTMQVADNHLACYKSGEQYPTARTPHLRGTMDGINTWDLFTDPAYADADVPKGKTENKPQEIYINTYLLCNASDKSDASRDDAPVWVQQVIILPAHTAKGTGISQAALHQYDAVNDTKPIVSQISQYNNGISPLPNFIRKRGEASRLLRPDLEKQLTNTQKNALKNGKYVAFSVGSLSPNLQTKALRYINLCENLDRADSPAETLVPTKPARWQEFQIRFLPERAGINADILGVVSVKSGGTRLYY